MNFQVSKSEFLRGLHLTQNIVQRRTTMPILGNVLIEAEPSGVSLTATDLDVSIRVKIKPLAIGKSGAICVNAKKLYEAVRELPDAEPCATSVDKGRLEVRSGKVIYRLLSVEATEFPSFPSFDVAYGAVDAAILGEMIKRTLFAVSLEEIRPDINGVLMTEAEGGKLRLVGTDGHRLAVSEASLSGLQLKEPVIVPRKGLAELKRLCEEAGEIRVGVAQNMVSAQTETVTLCVRTVEGEYPKYERVIPRSATYRMRVEQNVLLAALKRVVVLSTDRFRAVHLTVRTGSVELSADNPEFGEAREEIAVDGDGPEIEVSFNSRYILDVTEVFSPSTLMEIALTDQESPGLVTAVGDSSYLYVVMPVRS